MARYITGQWQEFLDGFVSEMYNQVGVERIRYNSTVTEQGGSIYIDAKGDFEGDIRTRSGKNQIAMTFVITEQGTKSGNTEYKVEMAMLVNSKVVVNATKKYNHRKASNLEKFGVGICYDVFRGFISVAQGCFEKFNEALV